MIEPGLFGLENCNRDFTKKNGWGKNVFNNTFPTALLNYMYSKKIKPVYLKLDKQNKVAHSKISVKDLFGIEPTNKKILYAFETAYSPYQRFTEGSVPRADLTVIKEGKNPEDDKFTRGLEIKLTALPDNSTYDLKEDEYSCELVIRPDTIAYLGYSIANIYRGKQKELLAMLKPVGSTIKNWSSAKEIIPKLDEMVSIIDNILSSELDKQTPILVQPVWKTIGKSPRLVENCLDVFVWSNFAFTRLFIDVTEKFNSDNKITRQVRTTVWLFKILYDFSKDGTINFEEIVNDLTYNVKNDKAFSSAGKSTYPYLKSKELTKPRIKINEIQNIILGGGESFLSPERRFDAVVVGAPGLFTEKK